MATSYEHVLDTWNIPVDKTDKPFPHGAQRSVLSLLKQSLSLKSLLLSLTPTLPPLLLGVSSVNQSSKIHLSLRLLLGFPYGSDGKESACSAGDLGSIPRSGNPLEKEMATHSIIPCLENSMDKKCGRSQKPDSSMESQRVRHD